MDLYDVASSGGRTKKELPGRCVAEKEKLRTLYGIRDMGRVPECSLDR